MPKSFIENFLEWVNDTRYEIGEDCGHEFAEPPSPSPTLEKRSLTVKNGNQNSEQKVLDTRQTPE